MDPALFTAGQREFLVKTLDGAWAFVPPPLPPHLDLGALALALERASYAVGELKGAARRLPNPNMLIDPLQRREALTSSAMEGTITTIAAMIFEEAEAQQPPSSDAREAYNYVRSTSESVKQLASLPISHRIIKNAHSILLQGLSQARGAGKRPGEYKVHQNAVGRLGENITSARYVPPPPAQALTCMDALERYINRDDQNTASRLIDLTLAHYQFEAIHPFDDGNGRIGRMLVTLMAIQSGLLDLPLLHVSAHIERTKDEYIDRLFAVSARSDWAGWINYFLKIVECSSIDAAELAKRILNLQGELRSRARHAGKSARLPLIVDSLFDRPWTTAAETARYCKVTFPTAQSDLRALEKAGLIEERASSLSARLYVAPEILALSERG